MTSLACRRAYQTLSSAASADAQLSRRSLSSKRQIAVDGRAQLTTVSQTGRAAVGGHLDFLVAGYDTSTPLGSKAAGPATPGHSYAGEMRRAPQHHEMNG
jgi:hypothetical protein